MIQGKRGKRNYLFAKVSCNPFCRIGARVVSICKIPSVTQIVRFKIALFKGILPLN